MQNCSVLGLFRLCSILAVKTCPSLRAEQEDQTTDEHRSIDTVLGSTIFSGCFSGVSYPVLTIFWNTGSSFCLQQHMMQKQHTQKGALDSQWPCVPSPGQRKKSAKTLTWATHLLSSEDTRTTKVRSPHAAPKTCTAPSAMPSAGPEPGCLANGDSILVTRDSIFVHTGRLTLRCEFPNLCSWRMLRG